MEDLVVNDWLSIPSAHFTWKAVRAGGPGGQNVNKVASKVELRFAFENVSELGPAAKQRLRTLAHNRLDADGAILIASQKTRDQLRNLEDAKERIAELVRAALVIPKARKATKPGRGAVRRRLDDKKKRSETKQQRGKVSD